MSRIDDIKAWHARMETVPDDDAWAEGDDPVIVFQHTYDDYAFLLAEVEQWKTRAEGAASLYETACRERDEARSAYESLSSGARWGH